MNGGQATVVESKWSPGRSTSRPFLGAFSAGLSAGLMVTMTGATAGAVLGGVIAHLYTVRTTYAAGVVFLVVVAVVAVPLLNNRTIGDAVRRAAVTRRTEGKCHDQSV